MSLKNSVMKKEIVEVSTSCVTLLKKVQIAPAKGLSYSSMLSACRKVIRRLND